MVTKANLSNEELSRYSRHITLQNVGLVGQNKIKKASILVVGAGGLGSPVIQYLASTGVGQLGIADNDTVDLTNLQRQVIHSMPEIGISKAISASNWVEAINPNCKVMLYNELITNDNAEDICRNYDIICDCTDNFKARYVLNDAAVKLKIPYIYGSILGFEGQVGVFNLNSKSPSYRDLVPSPPPADLLPSCVEGGVLGVLPGIIGILQATEALKIILELGTILDGKILTYNALDMKFRRLNVSKAGIKADIKNEKPLETSEISANNMISPLELTDLINKKENHLLVDVRSEAERDICSIKDSVNHPSDMLLNDIERLNELIKSANNKKLILYCKSGMRSAKCLKEISKLRGDVYSLTGGIIGWIEDVDKTMPKY